MLKWLRNLVHQLRNPSRCLSKACMLTVYRLIKVQIVNSM